MSKSIKKILIVVESLAIEESSGAKANFALISNLNKAGFEVMVLHYSKREINFGNITCIEIKENRKSILFFLSRLERLCRYKLNLDLHRPLENLFGFSFTHFNDRNSIIREIKKHQNYDPDIVLTLSQGASFRPHHALLRINSWHNKWMAYIHDPYPLHSYPRPYDYVEAGHQKKRSFFLEISEKAKYAAYPSKLLAEWMESYYPVLRGKAVIIPHQIPEEISGNSTLPEFFPQDNFTIVHAGALMLARNPVYLVKAFKNFLELEEGAKDNCNLFFLGKKSPYTRALLNECQDLPQLFVTTENLSFQTVSAIQKSSCVNVILEAIGSISPFLPGKFPHCIMADKPILLLGPYYSESRRLLGQQYEFWAEIDDVSKITKHIQSLYHNWLENRCMTLNREGLRDYLSSSNLKRVMDSLFI